MKLRKEKVIPNLGWAALASFFMLLWMDEHGLGVGGGGRIVVGLMMWACFAAYGSLANEFFTYPGLKTLSHILVPANYSPAFIPRVMAKVEAYHRGDVDFLGLVDAEITKATAIARRSALEYFCLIGIPEKALLDSLGAEADAEIRGVIQEAYKDPAWRKLYNLTAMITMAALFALVVNFTWTKALLATPALAVLKVLVGDRWVSK